jgi:hypothetical protein
MSSRKFRSSRWRALTRFTRSNGGESTEIRGNRHYASGRISSEGSLRGSPTFCQDGLPRESVDTVLTTTAEASPDPGEGL